MPQNPHYNPQPQSSSRTSPVPLEVIKDELSLRVFLRTLQKFDRMFCDSMISGEDFTLKLEVRGNKGELIHCRVVNDGFERPPGVEGRIERGD